MKTQSLKVPTAFLAIKIVTFATRHFIFLKISHEQKLYDRSTTLLNRLVEIEMLNVQFINSKKVI